MFVKRIAAYFAYVMRSTSIFFFLILSY